MMEDELGIVIGTIKSTEKVKGTNRLHIVKIDVGGKEVQIASGVPGDFEANSLVGKQVPIKIDVDPVKIRGIESNARFLAIAGENQETVMLFPEKYVPNGSKVW
jgi:methionyl-tRNA synthetase